jgi:hypothetical protein
VAEIGSYLPDDLTVLKRTVRDNTRNAVETEISLQDELDALVDDFNRELADALPDPKKALTLPFVEEAEDGSGIMLEDDSIIPYMSFEGAITVEILNAIADGADMDNLMEIVEKEIGEFSRELAGSEAAARGLYMNAGDQSGRWPGGKVNYRWGSLSEDHKKAVLTAMNDWRNSTGGEVYFNELSNSGWNNFQVFIHAIGVVNIFDYNFSDNKSGDANVGYGGGEKALRIKTGLYGQELIRTSRHELGHVLGLKHDHQRYDRDNYLIIKETDSSYNKVPKYISGWRWEYVRVRIGWWTISIPYPVFWEQKNSTVYGSFDFESIMLYGGLEIKNTNTRTKFNTALSKNDIATVKALY